MTKQYSWIFVLLLIALRRVQRVQADGIVTIPPNDTSVCYGGLATFYCGSERNDIVKMHWNIDSEEVTGEGGKFEVGMINTTYGNYSSSSTISIIGLTDRSVSCTAVVTSHDISIVPATLAVSDIPPVEDLNIEFNSTVMNVTWSEPSCLPVYYTYSITITDDNNQTLTTNTTDPLYTMPVWSNCTTNYTVNVTVIDTGYTSRQSGPNSMSATSPKNDVTIDREITVKFINEKECKIRKQFKIMNTCPGSFVTVTVDSYSHFEVPQQQTDVIQLPQSDGFAELVFGPFIDRYKGILSVAFGKNESLEFEISTFNVQGFSISVHSDGNFVQLMCFFAENSFAKGCKVFFESPAYNESFYISKHEDECFGTLNVSIPDDHYDIFVFEGNDSLLAYSTDYSVLYRSVDSGIPIVITPSTTTAVGNTASMPNFTHILPKLETNADQLIAVVPTVVAILAAIAILVAVLAYGFVMRKNHQNEIFFDQVPEEKIGYEFRIAEGELPNMPIPELSVIEKAQDNSVVDHKHTDSAATDTVPADEDMYSVPFSVEPHSPDMGRKSEFAIKKGLSHTGPAFAQGNTEPPSTNHGVASACTREDINLETLEKLLIVGTDSSKFSNDVEENLDVTSEEPMKRQQQTIDDAKCIQEEERLHESVNTNDGVYALENCKRNQLPEKKYDRFTKIEETANDGGNTSYSVFPEQCGPGEKDHQLDD